MPVNERTPHHICVALLLQVLHDYITGRVKKAGVISMVQCNIQVVNTTYDEATKLFTVRVRDRATNVEKAEEFDYVVCCSGHFSVPHVRRVLQRHLATQLPLELFSHY